MEVFVVAVRNTDEHQEMWVKAIEIDETPIKGDKILFANQKPKFKRLSLMVSHRVLLTINGKSSWWCSTHPSSHESSSLKEFGFEQVFNTPVAMTA